MARLLLAAALVATVGCSAMHRCRTDPRRYVEEIVADCETCDGGRTVCVERSPEDIADYDRAQTACEATEGAEWHGHAEECRCPQTPSTFLASGWRTDDGRCEAP